MLSLISLPCWPLILIGAVAAVAAAASGNSACDACVNGYHDGIPVSFCGTDMQQYSSYSSAFTGDYCFDNCGVMVYTAYSCGCPNDCGSSVSININKNHNIVSAPQPIHL